MGNKGDIHLGPDGLRAGTVPGSVSEAKSSESPGAGRAPDAGHVENFHRVSVAARSSGAHLRVNRPLPGDLLRQTADLTLPVTIPISMQKDVNSSQST